MATLGQPTAAGSGVARVASRHSDTNFRWLPTTRTKPAKRWCRQRRPYGGSV